MPKPPSKDKLVCGAGLHLQGNTEPNAYVFQCGHCGKQSSTYYDYEETDPVTQAIERVLWPDD